MARTRTVDHDAILDRWARGETTAAIIEATGADVKTIYRVVLAARHRGDPRAAYRMKGAPPIVPQREAPLHEQLGIKVETIFVATLLDCGGEHWRRTPVTVPSLHGGPVVYQRSTYRDRHLPGLIRTAVRRAARAAREHA